MKTNPELLCDFWMEAISIQLRKDVYELTPSASLLKTYIAVCFGEKRVVLTKAHIAARFEGGSPLAHKNRPSGYELTVMTLYPESLRLAISTILGTSQTLFVSHNDYS